MKLIWHRYQKLFAGLILLAVICCLVLWYFMAKVPDELRLAEMRARAFCDATPIGSDISTATSRAKAHSVFFGDSGGYTFYFPATIFDKAVCEVKVDQNGKVIFKTAMMEYD